MANECSHRDLLATAPAPSGNGCEECLKSGQKWVELRICQTGHPVMKTFPDSKWAWCYVDETYLREEP
jgi:hypothetical protein